MLTSEYPKPRASSPFGSTDQSEEDHEGLSFSKAGQRWAPVAVNDVRHLVAMTHDTIKSRCPVLLWITLHGQMDGLIDQPTALPTDQAHLFPRSSKQYT